MLTRDTARSCEPPNFVCPRCHGGLDASSERYHCRQCRADYPIVLGIPDFRLDPDPWIGLEDDRAKGQRVARESEGADFAETVRIYWKMTPGTPRAYAERFTAYVLAGEARASEWMARLNDTERALAPSLELGCGTGDLVAAAAAMGIPVTGIDVAFRWLVVALKRPGLVQGSACLVCCNAEHLPFAADSYGRILSVGTLEHCTNSDTVLSEAARVLRPGGRIRIKTVNRYSLLPEPHVNLWGVGFVPRRWADRLVQWRSGERYLHHRPVSRRELALGMRRAGMGQVAVRAAPLLGSERERLPRRMRWAASVYDWSRRAPLTRTMLAAVAPILDGAGVMT